MSILKIKDQNNNWQSIPAMKGDPGVSPAVTVDTIQGGHQVTITDATHPQGQSFNVMDGGISDAPSDGNSYVRKNEEWFENVVVNNCTTDDATKSLSARQGMILKGEIDEINETMQEDESGYVKFVDENGKIGMKIDRDGTLEVKEFAIVNEREEKLLSLTRDTQLKKINVVPNILILGDSYSQQGTWITGMKKYINVGNVVNLAVGSATVKDRYSDRETYPYTSRPNSNSNTGNLNVFACQVEKLKRLMAGTDLDAGETQLYTRQEEYPSVIIIEGGQNDTVDNTEKENAYYSQFQKSVSDVYIKRKNNGTAELGSCAIPTPLNEVDRTSFAGAYRYLVEELHSIFPNAQIFFTTRSHLSYWNSTSVSTIHNIARQQRIVASILSAPIIDWNAVGFINTITDHVTGDGTQQNPYVWAEANMPHTGDLLHPNTKGGDIYGQVAANTILMNLLNL